MRVGFGLCQERAQAEGDTAFRRYGQQHGKGLIDSDWFSEWTGRRIRTYASNVGEA